MSKSAKQIAAELDQTRARLNSSLTALRREISPVAIARLTMQQGWGGVADKAGGLVELIRNFVPGRRSRAVMRALAAVAVAALVLSGCDGRPEAAPSASPTSSPTMTAAPGPTVAPVPSGQVALYWVADSGMGLVLYREYLGLKKGKEPGEAALRTLFAYGAQPADPDYKNLWGRGSKLNSVTYSGELATVDLTIRGLSVGAEAEQRAIDQLVWTLTENHPATTQVLFKSDGEVLESFAGHVDTRSAFSRQPAYEVLAPIWIDKPVGRASNPVVATGTACTFEAAFARELRKNGKTIAKSGGLADQACPTRSPWRIELGTLEPGRYTLRVIDYSAEDGSINQVDSKVFRVS